jgi:hypothetical protein
MALMALLPKTRGQEWPPQGSEGLHSISDLDYQRNLCENYFDASDYGTPSVLGYSRVFADRLVIYLNDVRNGVVPPRFAEHFTRWSLLVQGLYFGAVSWESLDLTRAGELGRIVAAELPEGHRFAFLAFEGKVIGFSEPVVGVVPGARVGSRVFESLREKVQQEATGHAAEFFGRWARKLFQGRELQIPFLGLLDELSRGWAGKDIRPLAEGEERIFGEGPKISLQGERPMDGLVVEFPRFVGTPITCKHCGYEIGKEVGQKGGAFEIKAPDDCRCPRCLTLQDWLTDHETWIRYSEERKTYLIYAFQDSPCRQSSYPVPVSLKEDGVVITNGQFVMKIVGVVLAEERLKCARLTFFRDGERQYKPSLPICGDYFGIVDLAVEGARLLANGEFTVPLDVEGWPSKIYLRYAPDEIHWEEALLLTWPNFHLDRWKAYFYLLQVHPPLVKAGIRLRVLRRGSPPELLAGNRGLIEEPFEAFELIFQPSENRPPENAGIFRPQWVDLQRGETPVTLAVDFGTSTSAVWFQIANEEPHPLRFMDFSDTVIPNRIFSDKILEASYWLPTYRLDDRRTAARFYADGREEPGGDQAAEIVTKMSYFVPSELIIRSSGNGLGEPVKDYGICHPYGAKPDANVLYELKSLPVDGSRDGRFTFKDLVSSYLEIVMLSALASVVRRDPRVGVLKVRSSFPRAFSNQKLERFIGAFDESLRWIESRTGFVTNERLFLDESRAAAYAMPARGEMALVMDMGGGTTDIGFFNYKDGVLYPVLIDSLQYGGNDFLRLLVNEPQLFPKPSERGEDRLLWLFREIRLRGFAEVVKRFYTADTLARQEAARLLVHFFKPLIFFVRRLHEALCIRGNGTDLNQKPITVYLVGNGWSLAEGLPVVDASFGKDYRSILRGLLEQEGFKRVTIAGTPRPADETIEWPGPKAAVAYGVLKADVRDLHRELRDAESDEAGIHSIVGFDIEVEDGSDGRTPVAWSSAVPLELSHSRCALLLSGIKVPPQWKFIRFERGEEVTHLERVCGEDIPRIGQARLTRSVLGRFIENVYLKQLPNARKV